MHYLIGVDAGTQGTKAGLYKTDGTLVASHLAETRLIYRGDAIEQDPDELYASVLDAIRGIMEASGVRPGDVAAISIDGQMAGVMGVDKNGQATTPYDSWLDNRCQDWMKRMQQEEEAVIRLSGGCVTNHHGPKMLWWMNEQPEAWRKTQAFVTLSAYLSMRLCGSKQAYTDDTHLHFTGFADNENRCWDDGLTHAFGDVSAKLPPIIRCMQKVGTLTHEAAERCGLIEGIPVAAGCGDTAASALGAGVTRPDMALDVAGTASVLAMSTRRFVPDIQHRTLLYMRSVLDGLYTPLAYIGGGGLCIRWVSRLLGKSYGELETLAQEVPLGSNGLRFIPHFAGRVCPASPQMPGVWYGLKWNHGAGEMYRSVLESIAAEYRHYHEILLSSAAIAEGGVVIGTGGGAKSRLFCQLKADALQMEYRPLAQSDTALWGSAVVAGIAAGVYNEDGTGIPAPKDGFSPCYPHAEQQEAWKYMTRSQLSLADVLERHAQEDHL